MGCCHSKKTSRPGKATTGTHTALFSVPTAPHQYSTWTVPLTSNLIVSRMFRVPSTIRTILSKLIKQSASRKTCKCFIQTLTSLVLVSESFGQLKKSKTKKPFFSTRLRKNYLAANSSKFSYFPVESNWKNSPPSKACSVVLFTMYGKGWFWYFILCSRHSHALWELKSDVIGGRPKPWESTATLWGRHRPRFCYSRGGDLYIKNISKDKNIKLFSSLLKNF